MQEKRQRWMKNFEDNRELLEGRVKEDIEKYRKSECKIRLVDKEGNPLQGKAVTVTQKNHDFKFGAHLFLIDQFETKEKNQEYRELFKEYFNLATLPFYWQELEPERGKLRFDKDSENIYRRPASELCMEYCVENQIDAKLHCLVYEKYLPEWVPVHDLEEMERLYENRVKEIAERFAGRLYEFEVINETLAEHYWPSSVISDKRDVVEWAFALAKKYLPNETLVINETNPLLNLAECDYRAPYFMQLEKCLLNGAPIHKIGIQHHIFTGVSARNDEEYDACVKGDVCQANPKTILKALDLLAEFGLPLEMTEITIPTFGDSEEDEELQAEILKNLYSIWFSHPAMETIVYWNSVEGYCYKGDEMWDENRCRGALFHKDLTPKKAALMLKKLITEEWHTELQLVSDEEGYVSFRGFHGDYDAEVDGKIFEFGVHKGMNNEVTYIC